MDQMPYKRVFTKRTSSIFYGAITTGRALPKKIIEEVGIIMSISIRLSKSPTSGPRFVASLKNNLIKDLSQNIV